MSDFRLRILGLAALGTAFAGLSLGQQTITCSLAPAGTTTYPGTATVEPSNPTVRAEGETELLQDYAANCSASGAVTGASVTLTVTSGQTITSKALFGGGNEATLLINGAPTGTVSVSGSAASFSGVSIPAGAFTLQVSNIRVNASAGSPAPQITENAFITYGTPASNLSIGGLNAGFIANTLTSAIGTAPAWVGVSNYFTCTGNPGAPGVAAGTSFTVLIKELLGGVFKNAGPASAGGEGGSYVAGAAGTAASSTLLQVAFANIPAAATVYVPTTITVGPAGTQTTLTAVSAAGAPLAAAAAPYGGMAALSVTNNAATVLYAVSYTAGSFGAPAQQTFPVTAIVAFGANKAAAQSAMTAVVTYAPTGALAGPAASVPTFAAVTEPTLSGSSISLCQTTILFPFISNQSGFDTGIVFANTTTDNIVGSTALAASGACTMAFYGSGAPAPNTGVAVPGTDGTKGDAVTTGTDTAFLLSGVAPGFQGYAIATCAFLNGHGYAFLETGIGTNAGVAQGYLGLILTRGPSPGGTETLEN